MRPHADSFLSAAAAAQCVDTAAVLLYLILRH